MPGTGVGAPREGTPGVMVGMTLVGIPEAGAGAIGTYIGGKAGTIVAGEGFAGVGASVGPLVEPAGNMTMAFIT